MKKFLLNALILAVFITNNSSLSLLIITALFFSVCLLYGNPQVGIVKFLLLSSIVLAISLNLEHVESKTYLRMIQLFTGFLFFPFNISGKDVNINVIRGLVLYLFFFFVGNAFNIEYIQNLILRLYPTEGNSWIMLYDGTDTSASSSIATVIKQRLASVYYNPNILGQNMAICFGIYLLHCYERKLVFWDYLFILLIIILIMGSGSRTAFVAFGIVLFFFVKKFTNRFAFVAIVVPILAAGFYFIAANTRLLSIVSGSKKDSMDVKNQLLFDYFRSFSFSHTLSYLFGHMTFDIQFDYDIGDIVYNLGILGFLSIAAFMVIQVVKTKSKIRFFFSFLLLSYGATLIINYKFFILTLLVLSFIRALNSKFLSQNTLLYSTPKPMMV